MKTSEILKELDKYLPVLTVARLENTVKGLSGSIVMCMIITDIIRDYHSSQKNEDYVSVLLSELCKNHFKKQKQ
jgi:hypothetical protein